MTREELLDYTYFVVKHIERGVTPAWLVDKYMDTEHPLPPAEGAKKLQWSGYGELGNIKQQQPTAEGGNLNLDGINYSDLPIPKPSLYPAEGAEEILAKYEIGHDEQYHRMVYERDALKAMHEFATLHAQKIADKMVSERLREELINFLKWDLDGTYEGMTDEMIIDEYLKSREK